MTDADAVHTVQQ